MPVCCGDSLSEVTLSAVDYSLQLCLTSSLAIIVLYEHMTSSIYMYGGTCSKIGAHATYT